MNIRISFFVFFVVSSKKAGWNFGRDYLNLPS